MPKEIWDSFAIPLLGVKRRKERRLKDFEILPPPPNWGSQPYFSPPLISEAPAKEANSKMAFSMADSAPVCITHRQFFTPQSQSCRLAAWRITIIVWQGSVAFVGTSLSMRVSGWQALRPLPPRPVVSVFVTLHYSAMKGFTTEKLRFRLLFGIWRLHRITKEYFSTTFCGNHIPVLLMNGDSDL